MTTISVLLVDDHELVRRGLRSFLGTYSDIVIAGEAENGEQALALALEIKPDVVIMDISMPGMDGMEVTRRLKVQSPQCNVLALTVHEDKQYFIEMLAAGASGYVTKQAASDELGAAIKAVAAGQVYLQPALARWLLEDYQRLTKEVMLNATQSPMEADMVGLDVLSVRERQVLEFVGQGLNNQEIGVRLELSPKTIARHRERIMNKLSMHSRTELVKFAIRTGLIEA
jgi:DNA-binding NarL/FixJ family response regulator